MNFGDCPYEGCRGLLSMALPDCTPAYERILCPTCERPVWYRLSRIDPMAWTEADFLAEHELDETTRQVRGRASARPPADGRVA